jgi:class 3 adenylate cyclase
MLMSQVLDHSLADRARAALDRHAWREAFELLSEANAADELGPDELELFAEAAWWVGQWPVVIDARERAYAGYVKTGQPVPAAIAAVRLGDSHLMKNAHSVAAAWLNRADSLLEGIEEGPVHGWVAVTRSFQALLMGHVDQSFESASRALDIGKRFGDRNLQALALNGKGQSLLAKGHVDEALAMLGEATLAAVAGELEPLAAGVVYCATIGACAAMSDWRRAAEWTEAQDRWCEREQINGFPGMCRLHRAEIKRVHGSWLEAEAEARRASDELQAFIPAAVGLAMYEIGVIRLRRGDLPAAEEALLKAHGLGRDPEPALSLLRLAEGKIEAAASSIRRALEQPSHEPSWWAPPATDLSRLSLLPAQVEIALAAGDVAGARAAADELDALAVHFSSVAVRAAAQCARGAVQISEGELSGGMQSLRRGLDLWAEVDAPYEAARARTILADGYRAQDDLERAVVEVQAARSTFERLGAIPDLRRADAVLSDLRAIVGEVGRGTSAERVIRTFVFTDIVESTKLVESLGDEEWDSLIQWHDQALRSLFAEHGGEEIKTIGDGFFVTFQKPDRAMECAVAIQRGLAAHRQSVGFAPAVRIGVHAAEATRRGLDYSGKGVNLAARIGAVASGGEILASSETVTASARPFRVTERGAVALKGFAEPVEVVSIDWAMG